MLLGLPVNHDFAHVMEGRMEETIGRELRIQTITDEVYCLDTGTGTMSTRGAHERSRSTRIGGSS